MKGAPVAIHEAAHVVVGLLLGSTDVHIDKPDHGVADGQSHIEPIDWSVRDMLVGLAGRAAQVEVDPCAAKKRGDPFHRDWSHDLAKVNQIVERLCRNFNVGNVTSNRLWDAADAAIKRVIAITDVRRAIEAVAAAVHDSTLSHGAISEIVARYPIDKNEVGRIADSIKLALPAS